MYYYNKYTYQILDRYQVHLPLEDTIPLGFTGVAGQRPAPVFTTKYSEDILLFGATVNFSNAGVLVRIKSQNPSYEWMANDDATPQDTPVNAIAGVFSQAQPVMPLVQQFFLAKQGQLQLQFTNDTAAPITGGLWTFRGLRLTNPVDGVGWDYSMGFHV
jgi:hypothetical protein